MSSSVFYEHENVTLSLHKEEVITSPGYPYKDYERETNYTWDVGADDATDEISLNITMDIQDTTGFLCEDYLMVCVPKSLVLYQLCGYLAFKFFPLTIY